MKTTQPKNEIQQSTYALLVQSEEKVRGLFETVAYSLFILSAIAAIWQFAMQPINLPLTALPQTASVAHVERPAQS